ncbi:MAG: hypothetical protein AB7O52_07565 [Planctomycetota bacterium]
MILEKDDKIVASYRRLFPDDAARLFVGVIKDYDGGVARAAGYSWTWDPAQCMYRKDRTTHTQLIPVSSHGLIVMQVDRSLDLDALEVKSDPNENAVLTDGLRFELELSSGSATPIRQALTRT